MKIIKDRQSLDVWLAECRREGARVGFVPTMGALHQGHLSLLATAKRECGRTIVSIFVNPTQFGPGEDFDRYPRTFAEDQAKLAAGGCDAVFLPEVATIYPPGGKTAIQVEPLGSQLCGAVRPGHFQGVATVVTILLNLVRPHVAYFGLKDYQQFTLIRQMVGDLAMPVAVVGVPTVREADGLALSSRNRYLDPEQRLQAVAISRALHRARDRYQAGERSAANLETVGRQVLQEAGIDLIDYVEVRDGSTLAKVERVSVEPVMLIAARVGKTRLIDNIVLSTDNEGI